MSTEFKKNKTLTSVNPVETFLKDEYGIDNVMQYEFDDLKTKEHHDFVLDTVRGNVQLRRGVFRTFKESQAILDKLLKLDFKSLLKFKP